MVPGSGHKVTKPGLLGGSQYGRAPKACSGCRKKKTRCFSSKGIACSRCKSMNLVCSFEEEYLTNERFHSIEEVRNFEKTIILPDSNGRHDIESTGQSSEADKLNQIHEDVKKLVRYLVASDTGSSIRQMPLSIANSNNPRYSDYVEYAQPTLGNTGSPLLSSYQPNVSYNNGVGGPTGTQLFDDDGSKLISPLTMVPLAYITSPFNVLKESPTDALLPFSVTSLLSPAIPAGESDIVTLKFISKAEAFSLLSIFCDKYGKWISLRPNISTEELLSEYRKESPLLLDVACLIALRSSQNYTFKSKIINLLTQRITNSLSKQIISYPATDLKFISTLTLLAIYGYTLSTPGFSIDPWFYSGLGLKHFITSVNYNPSFVSATISLPDAAAQFDLLTYMRIYDHLLVTHLYNCIVSGRTCSIDRIRLNKVRSKLDIVFAGTFDGKMTAEVYLCDIVYDFFVNDSGIAEYKNVERKLHKWYDNWKYLIEQPIPQLLECLYNFYSLLIVYHVNFQFHYGNSSAERSPDNKTDEDREPLDDFNFFKQNNNFETFDSILRHTELHYLNKMLFNCLKVVNEILSFISKSNLDNIIDSSEQFEYFSDQIHFSLFFAVTVLIRILQNFFVLSETGELKQAYIDYFNTQFRLFDVSGDLRPYILKTPVLQAKNPITNISKDDYLLYVTEILIIIKKYFVSASYKDINNLFYRYYFTLHQSLLKCFPGLDVSSLF